MKKRICIPGENILVDLENEIIEEKTRAYQIALSKLYPFPLLTQPFVLDYRKKLHYQFNVLFQTAKEIYLQPGKKREIIKKNFRKYYQHTPLYSILLLQISPIFAPNFIRKVLKQLKRLNFRYFRRRIIFLLLLFERLNSLPIDTLHSDDEFVRRIFGDKKFLMEYIYSYIEIEQKKYRIIKKGGDWSQIHPQDYLHSFTLTSISFYHYVSSIWKTHSQYLTQFLKAKVADLYHLKTLEDGELEIVKSGKYRYKLIKEFPRPPKIMMELFHDPDTLMKNYPNKNIKIEKIAPNRLRYTISEKIPLMKIVLQYDLVYRFKGNIEEWWIENSNYIKKMTGFAVYEETPEGHCRYADILVDFELADSLKPFEDMIIPTLERIGRQNVESLMENIYQSLLAEDSPLLHVHRKECRELS